MVRLILAIVFAGGGLLISISGVLVGTWYFVWNDRILFVQPERARPATLKQLVGRSAALDQQWVRVKGRLWRAKDGVAFLVPDKAGTEHLTGDALARWLAERDRKGKASTGTLRRLPRMRLRVESGGFGLARNVSLKTIEVVTVLGRYYRGNLGGPRLNIGAIFEQRGDSSARLSVILFAALSVVVFGVGCSSIFAGFRILFRKKPETYFDEVEQR